MKNKYRNVSLILIVIIVVLRICLFMSDEKKDAQISYRKGKEQATYKKGTEVIKINEFTEHTSIVKKPKKPRVSVLPDSAAVVSRDSVSVFPFPFEKRDSAGNVIYSEVLNITTWPAVDSIKIDRDFVFNQLERCRVDTVEKVRTDTIKQVIEIEKPAPQRKFYDNFWAGAAIVALGVTIIVSIF